jgi:N-acetyl-anhydromuramyl-L-alanine amidase AmpD
MLPPEPARAAAPTAFEPPLGLALNAAPPLGVPIDERRQCRACEPRNRAPSQIDVIVIHTPEGGESATLSVLQGDRAGFDFYLPLSGKLFQCNDYFRFIAFQAGHFPTNVRGVGIEQGDFAARSGSFPEAHYTRLARLVAALCRQTSTPPRRVRELGQPGIIAHHDVTPHQRTDPGAGFRWDLLLKLVQQHLGEPRPDRIAELVNALGFVTGQVADALQAGLDGALAATTIEQRSAAYLAVQSAINTLTRERLSPEEAARLQPLNPDVVVPLVHVTNFVANQLQRALDGARTAPDADQRAAAHRALQAAINTLRAHH